MFKMNAWELSVGLYKGICFGIRQYDTELGKIIVFYLPFVDIAFEIEDHD